MKKNNVSYARIFNYVCVVLMLLLLVTQFLPFWNCADCEDGVASVSDYVWFPDHHKDITKEIMKEIYGKKFEVSEVVTAPIVIFASCVLGIIFCIKDSHKPAVALIPLAGSLFGAFGYLTSPGLQVGQNWILHLIACVLVAICALVVLSEPIVKLAKKKAANKQ